MSSIKEHYPGKMEAASDSDPEVDQIVKNQEELREQLREQQSLAVTTGLTWISNYGFSGEATSAEPVTY